MATVQKRRKTPTVTAKMRNFKFMNSTLVHHAWAPVDTVISTAAPLHKLKIVFFHKSHWLLTTSGPLGNDFNQVVYSLVFV